MTEKTDSSVAKPQHRRLWIYAIDPWAESSLATAVVSRCALPVRWEKLQPGPIGAYVEVIDVDPSSECVYDPVNLQDIHIIARDGLAPSEGSPQFHQQMVYAVVMKTIANFERALGREILWAPRTQDEQGRYLPREERYVSRLRLYPHALREANAYYSPNKKAILFGYFNAPTGDDLQDLPGGMVFTCLSHDIIAHETTHAILDGIHRRLLEPTNGDMLAFHEAFADIVAIFQHFTLPGLVLDQIRHTRGDLRLHNFLASLAIQFGRATKHGDALRNALGQFDKEGQRLPPDPSKLARTTEPHDRGAILVAAVFDAFLGIYSSRVEDLRRIATGGTGILPKGDIHPDLANRFADEAIKTAQRVLTICIRALDYLPPVDITFGDYLRALITADAELVPDDPQRYRVAFIEAFRKRGIFPDDVRALGEDTLRWRRTNPEQRKLIERLLPTSEILRAMAATWEFSGDPILDDKTERELLSAKRRGEQQRLRKLFLKACWHPTYSDEKSCSDPAAKRRELYLVSQQFARFIYLWLAVATRQPNAARFDEPAKDQLGLDLGAFRRYLQRSSQKTGEPAARDGAIEVHDVRPTFRVRPDGRSKVELLVMLTQRHMMTLRDGDKKTVREPDGEPATYRFRGGCTLLIDPELGGIRYAITKSINSPGRHKRTEQFLCERVADLGAAAFDQFRLRSQNGQPSEPLAILHRTCDMGAC